MVAPLRDRFRHDFRKSTFGLLSKAYNAISPASAAFYLGLDAASDTLVPDLESEGWIFDRESGLLKPVAKYENEVSKSGVEDLRIGRLTSLVTHLTEV